jgi:hypothetical protein
MPFIILVILLGCDNVSLDDSYNCRTETIPQGEIRSHGVTGPEETRCSLWHDVNVSLYEVIPSLFGSKLEARNWENVQLAKPTDYWELRGPGGIIAKAGNKCKTAKNQEGCITEFDALNSDRGVGNLCAQIPCYIYIVSNHGDSNIISNTLDGLKELLGTIDSKEEAIILATGYDFYGDGENKEAGAIREIDGEYEMIVLKLVDPCPLQENRYLIRIKLSGTLNILREQLYWRMTNTCA